MIVNKQDLSFLQDAINQQPTEKARVFKNLFSAEEAMQELQEPDWIVKGLIATETLSIFVGEAGHKKSLSLLDLSVCVAIGKPWLDFQTVKSPVLWIDEDNGLRRTKQRAQSALRGHMALSPLPELYFHSMGNFDAGNPDHINELDLLIRQNGIRLVIFDALQDIMPNADDNSAKETRPILAALRSVVEATKAAIIIVHHANKIGQYRGSTAIKGKVDNMISVFVENYQKNTIRFEGLKTRDFEDPTFYAEISFSMASDGNLQTRLTSRDEPKNGKKSTIIPDGAKRVVAHLLDNTEQTTKDIETALDLNRSHIYAARDLGYITRSNEGGQGSKANWKVTQEAETQQQLFVP